MIDRDIFLMLIGAVIALLSSLITALIQHLLTLQAEHVRRMHVTEDREQQELRRLLSEGARERAIAESAPALQAMRRYALEKFDELVEDENFAAEAMEKLVAWRRQFDAKKGSEHQIMESNE